MQSGSKEGAGWGNPPWSPAQHHSQRCAQPTPTSQEPPHPAWTRTRRKPRFSEWVPGMQQALRVRWLDEPLNTCRDQPTTCVNTAWK